MLKQSEKLQWKSKEMMGHGHADGSDKFDVVFYLQIIELCAFPSNYKNMVYIVLQY